jgi:cold shock CspA family protein
VIEGDHTDADLIHGQRVRLVVQADDRGPRATRLVLD